MAIILRNTWNLHAFPDETPAKEQLWAEEAVARRVEARSDLYLELSGSDLKQNRFTKDKSDGPNGRNAKGRALDDAMLHAIGSPAYQAAYDNQLTLSVGGEDIEITQGELHDKAKQHAKDLRRQIEEAKQRGASAEELDRLQRDLVAADGLVRVTDPQYGKADPDDVSGHLRRNPGLLASINLEGPEATANAAKPDAVLSTNRMNADSTTETTLSAVQDPSSRTTFAQEVEQSPFAANTVSPTTEFTIAANGVPQDQPAPEAPPPEQTPGFDLG